MLSKKTIIWLSNKQEELDQYITRSKGFIVDHEVLKKKIVAFFVELGEYANEERSFKYWANKPPSPLEIRLDEYIDGLHFIISIGNQIKFDFSTLEINNYPITNNVDLYFIILQNLADFAKEWDDAKYAELLNSFLFIIDVQKYTEDEIIEAYKIKNKVNFERQDNNY